MSDGSLIVVINNISPYREELPNLLALPAGAESRLRYQKKYLPTISSYTGLIGLPGLIAVRNRLTGNFMPLRMIKVAHSEEVGDTVYLRVQVGRIVNLHEDEAVRRSQVSSFDRDLRSIIGDFSNEGDTDLMNAVFVEAGGVSSLVRQWEIGSDYNETRAWGGVVRELAERFACLNIPFVRVASLVGDEIPMAFHPMNDGRGGFTVSPGRSYRITLLQRTYTQKKGDSTADPGRIIEIYSPDEALSFPWHSQSISGKVDICDFPISITNNVKPRYLRLFLKILSNGASPPPLPIPLTVKMPAWPRFLRGLSAAGFFAFIVVFLLAGQLGWNNDVTRMIERLAIVGMALTGAGTAGPIGELVRILKLSAR